MRTAVWVSGALLALGSVIVEGGLVRIQTYFNLFFYNWWVLPLSASVVSFSILLTAALLRHASGGTYPNAMATPAYLVPGPAMAVVSLSTILFSCVSPPAWVGYLMLLSPLCSALLYLDVVRETDKTRAERPEQVPPFAFLGTNSRSRSPTASST